MFKYLFRTLVCVLVALFNINLYAEDAGFITSHFSGSDNCASCHDGLIDSAGDDVSIARDWGASMMANATKDPFWRAKVATELERNENLTPVINETCTRCHAPVANHEITQVQGEEITLFGPEGILNPDHALYDGAMNGVTCTVCHQITDDPSLGTLDGFSGNLPVINPQQISKQGGNNLGERHFYMDIPVQQMIMSRVIDLHSDRIWIFHNQSICFSTCDHLVRH